MHVCIGSSHQHMQPGVTSVAVAFPVVCLFVGFFFFQVHANFSLIFHVICYGNVDKTTTIQIMLQFTPLMKCLQYNNLKYY